MESLKPLVTSFLVFLICAFVSACDYLSSDAQVLNEFRESTPFAKEVGQCVGATGNVEWRVVQPPGNKNPKLKVIEATLTKGEDRLNIQWFYNLETKISEMAYAGKPGEATNRLFMVMNIGLFCVQSIITGPKAGLKSEGEAPQQSVAEHKLPSRRVAEASYAVHRKEILESGWEPLIRPPVNKNWKPEFEENVACDEDVCESEFINKADESKVRRVTYIYCGGNYVGNCVGKPTGFLGVTNDTVISRAESEKGYEVARKHFED